MLFRSSNLNVGDVRVTRSGDGASITEQQKLTVTASDTVQNGASGFYRIKFTHGVQKPLVVTAIDHANTDQLTVLGHRYLEGAKVTLSKTVASLPTTSAPALVETKPYFVHVVDADTFTLHGALSDLAGTAPINKVNFNAAYTAGELIVTGQVQEEAHTTSCLHYHSTAAEVLTALETLPHIPAGHLRVRAVALAPRWTATAMSTRSTSRAPRLVALARC